MKEVKKKEEQIAEEQITEAQSVHSTEAEREGLLLLQKSKRGILQIVFGRTGIVLISVLIQMVVLAVLLNVLSQYVVYAFGGYTLFALIITIMIINTDSNPAMQIAWLIPTLLLPFFGGMFYLFVHSQVGHRLLHKRLVQLVDETRQYTKQKPETVGELREKNPAEAHLAEYAMRNGNFPIYDDTDVTYFPLGEDKFKEMRIQLENAKHYIFLEYFIVDEGYMWGKILEILSRKVKEGVEVRMMYDGTCAIKYLPYGYPKQLEELGIQCKVFAPIRPALSTVQNNRDHRKILVIDGRVAFTGGINLADEYINRKKLFGHWKDTAIMVEGEAVRSFSLMFLQMWNVSETREENYWKYLDMITPAKRTQPKGYILPYGDSPVDQENLAESIYLDIINRAVDYVHIMTPYLIISQEMIHALTFAAKRGVDVKIIMPHIPDKKYAFALAKTYYPVLLKAGVKIYEYTPGFIHAKEFVSDDERGVVGTINLDYRSLFLHFECGAYLYQTPVLEEIEKDMQETLKKCQEITLEQCNREKLPTKIAGRMLRLFAPLM